jgi:hypothetical protein
MVKSPVRSIVAAISVAAACWSDAGFPPRVRLRDAVSLRTGYSLPVVEYAFDTLFGSLRRDAVEAIIADELACLDVLDDFVERPGRPRARALPAGRVCVVSSRSTIGVAIVPAIFALCAKCEVLVKDREDYLAAAFFETVAGELGELRHALSAQAWSGERDSSMLGNFDVVVAFGDDATLARISAQVRPPARLVAYGSRISAGYLTRDALESERVALDVARRAARDLVLYESEGCLSLHALFVERGANISPERFGELLAAAVEAASGEFPLSRREARPVARLAAARDRASFGASSVVRTLSDSAASFLILVDPPNDEPPIMLPRALAIRSVESVSEMRAYFERHALALEALAVERARSDIVHAAVEMRTPRITPFGSLQSPPLGTFHGGRPRIAEFVRWVVDET